MDDSKIMTEIHPLQPFVEENTRILMLSSFPPVRSRWCMDWFYPNFQNDMWRIWGHIYKGDKLYFVDNESRRFDKERIVAFCRETGLGLFDTGYEVRRLTGNSNNSFLMGNDPSYLTLLRVCSLVESTVHFLTFVFHSRLIDKETSEK